MKTSRLVASAIWMVACITSFAQPAYPTRPVTLIVPFAANGPTDTIARTVGAAMGRHLKRAVFVENVAGAGGTVGVAQVARAEPDGYTVLLYHVGMATARSFYPDLPFDPINSFEPVGEVTDVPMTLVAAPTFPASNVKETIAYLKSRPKQVQLAHAGAGSASHLCGLLLMNAFETPIKTVAYKGTGPAMDDLLGGKVDLMCDQTTNTTSQIRAGKIKALGITTARRVASLPDVPTLNEAGVPNFHVAVWHTLYVPKGTPPEVVARLNAALRAALEDSAVVARLKDLGTAPVALVKATPSYAREHLASETKHWQGVIAQSRTAAP